MKMYICVLDEFPSHMVPCLVGHAVLRHHLELEVDSWSEPNSAQRLYGDWLHNSFRKCVVSVNQTEFDKIKQLEGSVVSWENKTLGGKESCITVVVDENIPNVIKFAKLWKPD